MLQKRCELKQETNDVKVVKDSKVSYDVRASEVIIIHVPEYVAFNLHRVSLKTTKVDAVFYPDICNIINI